MTGVLDGVKVGDKVVVTACGIDQVTRRPINVRSIETVVRVFRRVLQTTTLTGVDIKSGSGGWAVTVSPLLPGQEAEIDAENTARLVAEAEAAEALSLVLESAHRHRVLRIKIRDHLGLSVPEDVLQRVLDVLTGKDGA